MPSFTHLVHPSVKPIAPFSLVLVAAVAPKHMFMKMRLPFKVTKRKRLTKIIAQLWPPHRHPLHSLLPMVPLVTHLTIVKLLRPSHYYREAYPPSNPSSLIKEFLVYMALEPTTRMLATIPTSPRLLDLDTTLMAPM